MFAVVALVLPLLASSFKFSSGPQKPGGINTSAQASPTPPANKAKYPTYMEVKLGKRWYPVRTAPHPGFNRYNVQIPYSIDGPQEFRNVPGDTMRQITSGEYASEVTMLKDKRELRQTVPRLMRNMLNMRSIPRGKKEEMKLRSKQQKAATELSRKTAP
mmetsp:Transcript_56850/g.132509  ORF Transcript_56850/g.132509 Transcript_56850/m.132509 type:complete len:159 (-) Transcript_56850:109-585(-)|eukprot:CAMPEP_0171062788 /NCGR_PEP_ID=MMETSP0766_2-20121228/5243_1 /TAXON_ID=439317 /ORGANISM="Gambierdiscus australes, Strain CAWD 149" /LENGTH=158 /DNA_ID=CAMNT_0011518601 /DNA_START=89 /DNA_END=565 /DNA_ORIENTATION=-